MSDLQTTDETTTLSPEARAAEDAVIEERAERHAHDSGPLAVSQADQSRVLLRSPFTWVLMLFTVAVLAGLVFMAFHRHPVDGGRVRGPGDEAAPNAPPGYKERT